MHLLHMSQFMFSLPSVSDVRNYLNVWSGSVTFLPPKINSLIISKHCDPFINSLFCRVKMASASGNSLFVEEILSETWSYAHTYARENY
jgi:hypothetical protein